jgi:ParB family chromosome partitioning protein
MFFQTSPDLPRIVEIDLDRLTPNPDQPRKWFDEAALQELAASIEKHGLIQPIIVKEAEGDAFIIGSGGASLPSAPVIGSGHHCRDHHAAQPR